MFLNKETLKRKMLIFKKGAVPLEFGKKDKNGKQSKLCQN